MGIIRKVEDGIEFYTNERTGESGMSVSGLARLCGSPQSTVNDLLKDLVTGKARSKCLEPYSGKDLWLPERGPNNSKIVRDEVCAVVIEHYAFEANNKTEMALFAYRKFAALGVRAWIQEITGWKQYRKERIIRAVVNDSHSPWRKRYEDEFFEQAYRISGWHKPKKGHPPCMGKFIYDNVYGYFPEGVPERLREVNPKNEHGQRTHKHHQHLTPEFGLPILDSQQAVTLAVMRLSPPNNPQRFKENMQKACSNVVQIELPFLDEEAS